MNQKNYDLDEELKRGATSGLGGGLMGAWSGLNVSQSHPVLEKHQGALVGGGGALGAALGGGGTVLGDMLMGKGDNDVWSDIGHGALGGGLLGTGAGVVGAAKIPGGMNIVKYLMAKKGLGKVGATLAALGLGGAYGGSLGALHGASAASFNNLRRDQE